MRRPCRATHRSVDLFKTAIPSRLFRSDQTSMELIAIAAALLSIALLLANLTSILLAALRLKPPRGA
ncbi:MAG: hypothetical protein E5W45_03715, partial [Mesorhizobium sp.]